jgi:RNA polymerase sigma factor (sigma-70 family)
MSKNKFKYDIVKESSVESYEEFPKYFLADTLEEAENLYKDNYSLLNSISYTYSSFSNIPKSDLFGEAIIGLARANRDYDDKRKGAKFKTFTIYKIKTVLNEYVRKNSNIVVVPAYVKHASRHLELLKSIFKACDDDSLYYYLEKGKFDVDDKLLGVLKPKAVEAFRKLRGAAKRANISVEEIARRIEFMPTEIAYDEYLNPDDILKDEEDRLNVVLLVETLKFYLSDIEKEIAECIMRGMPYNKIARKFGRTTPWIRHKLINMKEKLEKKMGGKEFDL